MLLPLGDAPNPRGVPFMTYLLIGANIALYVLITVPLSAEPANPSDPLLPEYREVVSRSLPRGASPAEVLRHISAYDLFVFRHGFRPIAPALPNLFWSLFLHAGLLHLVGNMLFLWIYGDNVEHRLGRVRYVVGYIGTGIAATLFHTVFNPDSPLPLIGASGAISGVLGFYFVWFPHNQVRLLVLLAPFFMNVFLVSSRLVLGMYLVLDNIVPFLVSRGVGGGVAHGAHIGGFIAGLAAAWVIDRREVTARPAEFRGADAVDTRGDAGPTLRSLIRSGRFDEAARLYFAQGAGATRGALNPDDLLTLADWLARNGHAKAALSVYLRHLRDFPHDPRTAEAHLGAGQIEMASLGQAASAYQHFLDALDLDPSPEVAKEARAALHAIESMQKRQVGHTRAGC